jgi:hypothetical protein
VCSLVGLAAPGCETYIVQGAIEDDAGESESFDLWFSYWRRMFPEVTLDGIREFEVGLLL